MEREESYAEEPNPMQNTNKNPTENTNKIRAARRYAALAMKSSAREM